MRNRDLKPCVLLAFAICLKLQQPSPPRQTLAVACHCRHPPLHGDNARLHTRECRRYAPELVASARLQPVRAARIRLCHQTQPSCGKHPVWRRVAHVNARAPVPQLVILPTVVLGFRLRVLRTRARGSLRRLLA